MLALVLPTAFPINERWSLTPGVRYALTGSVDRATLSSVTSGTLMSTYTMPVFKEKGAVLD